VKKLPTSISAKELYHGLIQEIDFTKKETGGLRNYLSEVINSMAENVSDRTEVLDTSKRFMEKEIFPCKTSSYTKQSTLITIPANCQIRSCNLKIL
jgi:hypothetical protein